MCLHNAKRDVFILSPVRLGGAQGDRFWNPLSGEVSARPARLHPVLDVGRKKAKGRLKRALAVSASFLPILSSIAEMISILTVSPQTEQ